MAAAPETTLLERLRALEDMNPDLSAGEQREFYSLAAAAPKSAFGPLAEEVERLLSIYQQGTIPRVGKAILQEYFQALEKTASQLLAAGEISAIPDVTGSKRSFSQSLVLYSTHDYSALDRCRILNRAEIPEALSNAADSYRRRLEVVDTAFGIGFEVLYHLDPEQFQQWAVRYLDEHAGALEPEVIRDLLHTLRNSRTVIPQFQEWLIRWCADEALLEHWPLVTRYADRLLGRLALRAWKQTAGRPRNGSLAHLKLLAEQEMLDEKHLYLWLVNTLQNFGEGVERFMSLDSETDEAWRHTALVRELHSLAITYRPILVVADLLLTLPDGAAKLAMAFLGIIGAGLDEWEKQIRLFSEKLIRRAFLLDLKEGRKPIETIRKYTFGDDVAFNLICNELDLVNQRFDSIAQREKIIRRLAVFYASYRRGPMLGVEVAKRYRHLARILHEDFLQNNLSREELAELQKDDFLHELYTMASLAKRFLDHRRALEMTVEEMIASEIEFTAQVRSRRLDAIRKQLQARSAAAES